MLGIGFPPRTTGLVDLATKTRKHEEENDQRAPDRRRHAAQSADHTAPIVVSLSV